MTLRRTSKKRTDGNPIIRVFLTFLAASVDAPIRSVRSRHKAMPMTASRIPDIDLENWMGNLPRDVKNKSLTWLSIPGSHNSGTCDLSSEAGNDAFCLNIPIFARPWATCQRFPITYQLEHGIRYLDFRLDFDSTKDRFFITHFLRSKSSPKTCLESVKIFLEEHPKEVVIIDFQHFYRDSLKDQFLAGVLELFGSMVCPVPNQSHPLTLAYMQENGFQVVLINRYQACTSCHTPKNLFFVPSDFPTYWPDTDNATEVIDKANMASRRQHSFGYITQLVLTLQGAKNFVYLDLRNFYKSRMYGKAMSWLHNITGGSQPNIIITDFIDFHNFSFPMAVVRLNYLKEGESLAQLEQPHVNVESQDSWESMEAESGDESPPSGSRCQAEGAVGLVVSRLTEINAIEANISVEIELRNKSPDMEHSSVNKRQKSSKLISCCS